MLKSGLGDDVLFDYGDLVLDDSNLAIEKRRQRKIRAMNDYETIAKAKLIHGHFYATKYLDLFPSANFYTVMRNPVSLVMSYYDYLRTQNRKGRLIEIAKSCESIEQFIEIPNFQNIMSKLIWPLRLDDFAFIGFVEDFNGVRDGYSIAAGAQLAIEQRNVAKVKSDPLPPKLLERIQTLNAQDIELYENAIKRFSKK